MPRSCAAGSPDRLYDASENEADLEYTMAKIMLMSGIPAENLATTTIDEAIDALRETLLPGVDTQWFGENVSAATAASPGVFYTKKEYDKLIKELRWSYFDIQLARFAGAQ